jgi:UDP-2,3-diacylglucosamine pyrophosphatase LpxH
MNYKLSHSEDTVTVRLDNVTAEFKQSFLLLSDIHWDNPHCDRGLLRRLLDEAKNTNSGILMIGDTFCAMQGKGDKRGNKSSIRPEHTQGNYFDLLVNTAASYFEPYNKNIVMISYGNHETSIINHNESDIVERLCDKLAVIRGGYGGFVQFRFSRGENVGSRITKTLYYHHGHGGGGEATKGVPMAMRRAVYVPDADIVATGHIHESWMLRLPRVRVSASGKTYFDEQLHLQLPTFKQEHDLKGGYHVEKGRPPKPLGGWWLDFSSDIREHGRIRIDARVAK